MLMSKPFWVSVQLNKILFLLPTYNSLWTREELGALSEERLGLAAGASDRSLMGGDGTGNDTSSSDATNKKENQRKK